MKKIAVIGMGPAGLMAAQAAANAGAAVTIFDRNEKAGKKLFITGKGRCNLTNDISSEDFLSHVVSNPKFLFAALNEFTPQDTLAFFEDCGLKLKIERGGRVFPESDKAYHVTDALVSACRSAGVKFRFNERITALKLSNDNHISGIKTERGEFLCDAVILATGGASYPSTGSTGDGYTLAQSAGHTVVPIAPALCGINLSGDYKALSGLALKNVTFSIFSGEKRIYSDFGELTFMPYGISGPVVLSASSKINRLNVASLTAKIDWKPALTAEVLDARILRDFNQLQNQTMEQSLVKLLPKQAILPVLKAANISPSKNNNSLSKKERDALVSTLKAFPLILRSLRSIEESIVTAGGVSVKEVNPKTMQSKLVPELYFAGEVLDLDAFTGGYNIQIALSTGVKAGKSAALLAEN